MDKRTVNQDEFIKKTIEEPHNPYLPSHQLQVGDGINAEGTFTSVSHEDYQGKHGEAGSIPIHGAMHLSTLSLGNESSDFPTRTKSQDDFGLKVAHKSNLVRQENQLKIDTTCKIFYFKKFFN